MYRIKHPFEVKILIFFIAVIGAWNLLRVLQIISSWQMYSLYKQNGTALYLAISGAVWLITSLLLGYGLWLCKSWAWRTTLGMSLVYVIWQVFDRLMAKGARSGDIFALIVVLILVAIFYSLLFSNKVKGYLHGE